MSAADAPANVQKYENFLLVALANNVITEGEKAQLATKRKELNISDGKHAELIQKFRQMGMFTVERGLSSADMSDKVKQNDGGILYWSGGHRTFMRMNGKMEVPTTTNSKFNLAPTDDVKEGGTWTELPELPKGQRSGAGYCVMGQRIIVAGGWSSQMMEEMVATVDLFDPEKGTFTNLTTIPGGVGLYEPRVCFYPTDGANKDLAGSIILTGGRPKDDSPNKAALDHVLTYNMASKQWSKLASMTSARASHMMALDVDKNKLIVSGGWASFKSGKKATRPMKPLKTAECLDLKDNSGTWQKITDMRGERSGAGCCMWMGHFLVAGGQDCDRALNTAEYYNFGRKRWVALPRMYEARAGCFAGVVSDELLVCGGDSVLTGGYTQETIEMYDEDNMGWTKLNPPSKFYPELLDKAKPKKGLKFNCQRADGYGGVIVPPS